MRRLMLDNMKGGADMWNLPLVYQKKLETDVQEIVAKDVFKCNNRIVISIKIPRVQTPSNQDRIRCNLHTPTLPNKNPVEWLGMACRAFKAEDANGVNTLIDGFKLDGEFWVFSQYLGNLLPNGTNATEYNTMGNENTRFSNEMIDGLALCKEGYAGNPKIVAGTEIKVWGY